MTQEQGDLFRPTEITAQQRATVMRTAGFLSTGNLAHLLGLSVTLAELEDMGFRPHLVRGFTTRFVWSWSDLQAIRIAIALRMFRSYAADVDALTVIASEPREVPP